MPKGWTCSAAICDNSSYKPLMRLKWAQMTDILKSNQFNKIKKTFYNINFKFFLSMCHFDGLVERPIKSVKSN